MLTSIRIHDRSGSVQEVVSADGNVQVPSIGDDVECLMGVGKVLSRKFIFVDGGGETLVELYTDIWH